MQNLREVGLLTAVVVLVAVQSAAVELLIVERKSELAPVS